MTFRLFTSVVSMEARTQMSYRVDFWVNALVGFVVTLLVAYFLWGAIYAESGSERIAGYTFEGMVGYYMLVTLVAKIVRGPALDGAFQKDIYEGSLTKYLVYPVPYFTFKYAQALGALAPAVVQLAVFGTACPLVVDVGDVFAGVSVSSVAMGVVSIVVGHFLLLLLVYTIQGTAFWADNVWSLNVMLRFTAGLLGGEMLPLDVFPAGFRAVVDWLPFRFLYHGPVRVLTGHVGPSEWLAQMGLCLVWCLAIGLAGRTVWRRGGRVYTGVGI